MFNARELKRFAAPDRVGSVEFGKDLRAGDRRIHRAGWSFRWLLMVALAGVLISACGSSGGTGAVKVAQARVSVKQKAVSDAQSTLAEKSAAFCQSSQTYISALDRYGDVLNQTAVTVGDVKDAGTDLVQPREAALSSAEAATAAQQELVAAEKELADANVALAAAQAAASGQSTTSVAPVSTTTVAPLAPTQTVNRVKQAEADFTAAQKGITDQTRLIQASQQFNAAAVALELSWLRLFADAGCLTDEQQKKAEAAVRDYTMALQQALTAAGYYHGPVDGVYGPTTVDAVKALQKAHGLPVTGTVDKATDAALQSDLHAKGGAAAQQALASTAAVQQTLKLAGFWTGPVDGIWTPALTDALKAFQTALGVEPTGTVDPATIAAFEHAIATAKQPEAPSTTTSTTAAPTTTPPATGSTTTVAP
jgi:peptidoglycan hydrolase-like protein with peptidoglycan-binding domain